MDRRCVSGRFVALLALAALLSGCAGAGESLRPSDATPAGASPVATATAASSVPTSGPSPLPVPTATPAPPTAAGLAQFDAAARAFVDRFNADWADAAAAFARFTPQAIVIDPSNGDFTIGPGPDLVQAWSGFARMVPRYHAATTASYVSDVVAAFPTEVAGLGAGTPDGLSHELRVFRFTDATASWATAMELWYEVTDALANGYVRLDCAAPDRCVDDATAFAAAYLAAWMSGDVRRIARLYSADATFIDGARGIELRGATRIGQWGEPVLVIGADATQQRFGGNDAVCQVRDVYFQTDSGDPRTTDNTDPKGGSLAGIAIAYRCELGSSAGERPVDATTLLLFGRREARSFDNDPDGLIVSEEVLYEVAGATAAGLVP